MPLKFRKISSVVKYEKVLDFARETDIIYLEGYYMKPHEIISCRNIPVYIKYPEQVTHIYLFNIHSSEWVMSNLDYNIKDNLVIIPEEFMYKFDLVRVTPANEYDSYLRVMLKRNPENVQLFSIEDELNSIYWK